MSSIIGTVFGPDNRYQGVNKIHIHLLRILFALMLVFLGWDSWTHIVTFTGVWDPQEAAAWSMWAAYSVLALIGIINPIKMLPLVSLEIIYKVIWLVVVAYPLWSSDQLVGSPAEETTYAFLWVMFPIIAMPWRYAFATYILRLREKAVVRRVVVAAE